VTCHCYCSEIEEATLGYSKGYKDEYGVLMRKPFGKFPLMLEEQKLDGNIIVKIFPREFCYEDWK
jgi:hypothetical protein